MTTEPTAEHPRPASSPASPASPHERPIPISAAPYGVAPIAASAPRRSRRRRLVDAAVISTTLATLPIAAAWNRAESPTEDPTLVEAVSTLDAADDATAVRATTSALRSTARAAAGPPAVDAPAVGPLAPAGVGALAPAPAPAPGHADPTALTATPAEVDAEPASPLVEAASDSTATAPTPIARAAGVEIVSPAADAVLVGFHEAAGAGTETLESLAPLAVALNGAGTPVAPDVEPEQVSPVMELPTRDRAQAASSAVDIAVPAWRDITAPVTGTVVAANAYTLYGEFPDNRVEIEPEGHPGVRVVVIHIGEVQVRPGDEVVAGETLIARTAKQFPFSSQIDRFAAEVSGEPRPHVHLEVRRVG